MQTNLQREQAYDRYLEVPDMPEWNDADIKEAIDALEADVLENGVAWDEGDGYLQDLGIEAQRIVQHEPKDEWAALIKTAFESRVHDWCVSVVKRDPNFYCGKYCE